MSLPIEEVIAVLRDLKVPADILVKAETQLEQIEQEKKEEKAADGPKQKSQYSVVLLDPDNRLAGLPEFAALVVQLPENDDVNQVLPRIYKSVYDQRAAAKRKIKVINTVVEAAEWVKRKFLKENNIHIKTKAPVQVIVSNNQIPNA